MEMAFQKCQRSCRTQPGWRLATVDEVQRSLQSIKQQGLLIEFERARLLDGWIEGSSDDLHPIVGFRSCLGYMLLVQCPIPEICCSDDMVVDRYSDVYLDEEGMRAAFFLCCEDWNYEVVYWSLNRWSKDENQKFRLTGNAGNLTDKLVKTSEEISKLAMAFHCTRPMERVKQSNFTRSSMIDMVADILERMKGIESWDAISWNCEAMDAGGQCWNEMGLTSDLARFQEFRFNTNEVWDELADIVWYVTADALAVAAIQIFVRKKYRTNDQLGSTSQTMDDQAFVISIMSCANQILRKKFFGQETLWTVVKAAAERAKGNCQSLKFIIREEGFGSFSHDCKYGILNSLLVSAAKIGDANLVKTLLEYGVQPLETDVVRGKTALHHAAHLVNEDYALRIARTLLSREKGTGEALANARDHKGRTALHRAAYRGHSKLCKLLLDHHSDICAKDKNDQNPLHYAIRSCACHDEVIDVLISEHLAKPSDSNADTSEKRTGRVSLVDEKDKKGKTCLDLATEYHRDNVRMVARLLSESDKPKAYSEKLDLASCMRQYSVNGDVDRVKKMLELKVDPLKRDSEGRTALHLAAEGKDEGNAKKIMMSMLFDEENQLKNTELAGACDKYGRTVLHVAAFVGHLDICKWLLGLENEDLKLDTKDRDDQSPLYYAVAGHHDNDEILLALIYLGSFGDRNVRTKDCSGSGTTPLHLAAEQGNHKMVAKLLSKNLILKQKYRQEYVRTADVLGQTALHKAASAGHVKVVGTLLENGAHALEERDCDGKTALHHAVEAENEEDAIRIVNLLLNNCDEKVKSLLLFASAVGIGYAEESLESMSELKKLILEEKAKVAVNKVQLIELAAESGNIDMTRELLSRGASTDDIANEKGRTAFADGLAALFLNPFVKSPITVGISGEWGMGKSSLMIQTESILLKTAAQLVFIDLLQIDEFPGSRKSKSRQSSEVKNERLGQLIGTKLSSKKEVVKIGDFLSNYQAKYHAVYKSLAVMDHGETGSGHVACTFDIQVDHIGTSSSAAPQSIVPTNPSIIGSTVSTNVYHFHTHETSHEFQTLVDTTFTSEAYQDQQALVIDQQSETSRGTKRRIDYGAP